MDINKLKKNIYDFLTTSDELNEVLKGGLHYSMNMGEETIFPYCIYEIVAGSTDRDSATLFEDVTVQLTVVDNSSSSMKVAGVFNVLDSILQDAEGSFDENDNFIILSVERSRTPREAFESGEWTLTTDFEFQLQMK